MTARGRKARRVVRSFSLPPSDYEALLKGQYKLSLTGRLMNESETVRAGIQALLQLSPQGMEEILERVPRLKGGR